jgi:hypothetical protein
MKLRNSRTLPRQGWRASSAAPKPTTGGAEALGGGAGEEVARERFHVVGPAAQRRQFDRHHGEAVIEVFAERTGGDHRHQIAVGGRDDPAIERDFLGPADAADTPGLQRAQQAGLRLERHVADFVEKQGAARGLLELADLARHGAGESAFLVAEQLAFDQLVRDGGGVDRHERTRAGCRAGGSLRPPVPCRCRIAQDQHGQIVAQHA